MFVYTIPIKSADEVEVPIGEAPASPNQSLLVYFFIFFTVSKIIYLMNGHTIGAGDRFI